MYNCCDCRCPPAFDILLRILSAYTAASRSWLHEHAYTQNCIATATPESLTSTASHVTKQERDELRIALTVAQESAIIQLLLEICLPTEEDKKVCHYEHYMYMYTLEISTGSKLFGVIWWWDVRRPNR